MHEIGQEDVLQYAQNEKYGEERVEVDVKSIQPFHRLFRTISQFYLLVSPVGPLNTHIMVRNVPRDCGNCKTSQKRVKHRL